MKQKTQHATGSLKPVLIPTDRCIYDIDNPRIEPLRDSLETKGSLKQKRTNIRHIISARDCEGQTSTSYEGLKRSIFKAGLRQPIEVVKKGGNFLVTSGNTRLCIFEDLARSYSHDKRWFYIPARVIQSGSHKEKEISTVCEHLCRGRDWPAQATAHKIYELIKDKVFSLDQLAEITGTTAHSLAEQKDAYEEFQRYEKPLRKKLGEKSRTEQFSIWVEAQSPVIHRAVLLLKYKSAKAHAALARLIIENKFSNAAHIRSLPKLIESSVALNTFYRDGSGEALKVLEQQRIKSLSIFELINALHDTFTKWYERNKHLKKSTFVGLDEFLAMKSFQKALNVLLR
jgi:hypothetical protein